MTRLSTAMPRDATSEDQWTYFDESKHGFTKELAESPRKFHGAFHSKQPRLLIETRGTYNGTDPRALQADGMYDGYHLNKVYDATALVSTYRASGVVQSTGPRIQDRMGDKAYDPPPSPPRARSRRCRALTASTRQNARPSSPPNPHGSHRRVRMAVMTRGTRIPTCAIRLRARTRICIRATRVIIRHVSG